MNKCFPFHQSQSSTWLCGRRRTVRGRHFPSISFHLSSFSSIQLLKTQRNQLEVFRRTHGGETLCLNTLTNRRGKQTSRHFMLGTHPLPHSLAPSDLPNLSLHTQKRTVRFNLTESRRHRHKTPSRFSNSTGCKEKFAHEFS